MFSVKNNFKFCIKIYSTLIYFEYNTEFVLLNIVEIVKFFPVHRWMH